MQDKTKINTSEKDKMSKQNFFVDKLLESKRAQEKAHKKDIDAEIHLLVHSGIP